MTQPLATPDGNPAGSADHSLDCRGLLCPLPVYKASLAMKQLQSGQVLEILCTDPGSLEDFPAFAKQGGHELLSSEDKDGLQKFYIRKGAS
jgi:tRNA 2-thiouridine synthesizing protein A